MNIKQEGVQARLWPIYRGKDPICNEYSTNVVNK
jgi:hypothetical protein